MIYAVVFSCLVALSYGLSPELKAKAAAGLLKAADKCKVEASVSPEDLATLMTKVIPPSHEAKCFLDCIHKHFGMQDADGKINLEVAINLIEELKADDAELYGKWVQVFQTCIVQDNVSPDECQTAANIAACTLKVSAELGVEIHMR